MRILQVVCTLAPRYGGPAVACPELSRELVRQGHEVAGIRRPPATVADNRLLRHGTLRNFTLSEPRIRNASKPASGSFGLA